MLNGIAKKDHSGVLSVLRWLAYAQSPPSLDQLAEASIIDPTNDPTGKDTIDIQDRGSWEDVT